MELAELEQKIIAEVERVWKEKHAPILLAQLGTKDQNDIANAARQVGVSLSNLIENGLKDRLRLIRHSLKPQRIAVLPRNEETTKITNTDVLFDEVASPSKSLRYDREFWFAFQSFLPEGRRRYVVPGSPVLREDLAEDAKAPENSVEISREFILDGSKSKDDFDQIHRTIEKWAAKTGADLNGFIFKAVRTPAMTRQATGSLLEALLHVLHEEQLKRVSLPLDVIAELLRRKI